MIMLLTAATDRTTAATGTIVRVGLRPGKLSTDRLPLDSLSVATGVRRRAGRHGRLPGASVPTSAIMATGRHRPHHTVYSSEALTRVPLLALGHMASTDVAALRRSLLTTRRVVRRRSSGPGHIGAARRRARPIVVRLHLTPVPHRVVLRTTADFTNRCVP